MRARWSFVLLLGASCAGLEPLEPEVCGNGVIEEEAGEDCDLFANGALGPNLSCAAPDAAHACKYVCEANACPIGWSCGPDGVCRYADGTLSTPPASPEPAPNDRFFIVDADGDGKQDVFAQFPSAAAIYFGDGIGGFRDSIRQEIPGALAPPVFIDDPPRIAAALARGVVEFALTSDRRADPVLAKTVVPGVAAPLHVLPLEGPDLYFWTVGEKTVATFDLSIEPTVLDGLSSDRLASQPAIFEDEVVFAFRGEPRVWVYERAGYGLRPQRIVTLTAPVQEGAFFLGPLLLVSTGGGIDVVKPGELRGTRNDAYTTIFADFPLAIVGTGFDRFFSRATHVEALTLGSVLAGITIDRRHIELDDGVRRISVDTRDPARNLLSGDLDLDGLPELIFLEENAVSRRATVSVIWNDGGWLRPQVDHLFERSGVQAISYHDGRLQVVLQEGDELHVAHLEANAERAALCLDELEGLTEVVAGHFFDRGVMERLELASGRVHSTTRGISTPADCPSGQVIGIGDHDGDGLDSLFFLDEQTLRIFTVLLRGEALVRTCESIELPAQIAGVRRVRTADVDLDGAQDLLVEGSALSVIPAFRGAPITVLEGGYSFVPINADLDVYPELAVLGPVGVRVAKLDPAAKSYRFLDTPRVDLSIFGFGQIEAADFDDDGLLDLVFSDREQLHLRYLRAHGELEVKP